MKWIRTEFSYHPQLLQVQITTTKLKKISQNNHDTEETWEERDHSKDLKPEVTKSWNDQRISTQLKRRREATLRPSLFFWRKLIWNQKFVPTQQLWQSTRPNAALSPPHTRYTASSPRCGVGCYPLVYPCSSPQSLHTFLPIFVSFF